MPEPVGFRDGRDVVRFSESGIEVNDARYEWASVGALGILDHATHGRGHMGGFGNAMPGPWMGCLAVCILGEVDVVPAFGLIFDCIGATPSAAERNAAVAFLERELEALWSQVPLFAPAGHHVQDWWRLQVYGPGSHAHTDAERVEELRADLASMNERLKRPLT